MKTLAAIFFLLPFSALAGGSVSFSEHVLPLLKAYPELSSPVLREFNVEEEGDATRIGARVCPALGGTRVSPYLFRAKEKERSQAEFLLVVNTDIDFFDSHGRIVFRIRDGEPDADDSDFSKAVRMSERLSSLVLKVIRTAE